MEVDLINKEVVIDLQRLTDNKVATTGSIDLNESVLVTLEDTGRDYNHDGDFDDPGEGKVWGKTRILCGKYELKLRDFNSTMHTSYQDRFVFHRGMLELQNVPQYKDVYIHIGNQATNTAGCILVGCHKVNDNWIDDSEKAYIFIYGFILALLDLGFKVFIHIKDEV